MPGEASVDTGMLSPDGRWRWDGAAWQPAAARTALPSRPTWFNLGVRSKATWIVPAIALSVGLLADQALRAGVFGAAASLTLVFTAVALALAGRLPSLQSRALAGASALFAVWLMARASPWLTWPDLAMSGALLVLAASLSVRGELLDMGAAEAGARSLHAIMQAAAGAAFVLRPVAEVRHRLGRAAPLARGLLIAAPIAAVLAGLLAAADPVFASFFSWNLDLGQLSIDVFFVVTGGLAAAGLLRLCAAEPVPRVDGPAWRLGAIEGLVVLAVLDAIFAAFAAAQGIAAAGAAGATLRAAGVTYSDYARSGFFQLLWVAGLTAIVLILFSRITGLTDPAARRAFRALGLIAIGLTLVIVFVAYERLSLYEDAYGFTMLRLYSHVFAVWLALVFVLLGADVAGLFRHRRWLVGATSISAIAVLLAMNLINPESVVAQLNVERAQSTHKLDVDYLAQLSDDATLALLAGRSQVDPALARQIGDIACRGPRSTSTSWAAFNTAGASAAGARHAGC